MLENTTPELVRTDLTEICLQTKLLEKNMPIEEYLMQAISPPQTTAIQRSIKLLDSLGALDEDENLTTLGFHLADIPVDAKLSKMLIYGIIFKCIDPILTLVGCLSIQDPFVIVHNPVDKLRYHELKQDLAERSFSDHLVLLRIFQRWNNFKTENSDDRQFCEDHFINNGTMERINGTRSKIIGHLRSLGIIKSNGNLTLMNTNSTKWSVIKLCLAAGLYPSIAKIDQTTGNISSARDKRLVIHATSSLCVAKQNNFFPTEWAIFEEKFKFGKMSIIKSCTMVTGLTIALTAGKQLEIDDDNCILQVDDWIKFIPTQNNVLLVFEMRRLLDELMNKYLKDVHDYKFTDLDGYLIDAIANIVQIEDESNGFPCQHSGIGARPRAITLKSSDYDDAGTSGSQKIKQQHAYLSQQQQQSNHVPQIEPRHGLSIDNQSKKVQEVPLMNSKRFIMVKLTVALFKSIFGDRTVADAREFNFPCSFYEYFVNMDLVSFDFELVN